MGLLFLIYYCVSVYSAKGEDKDTPDIPLDVGSLPEAADADFETDNEITSPNPLQTSEVSKADDSIKWKYLIAFCFLTDECSIAGNNHGHAHTQRCAHLASKAGELHAAGY